MSSVFYPFIRCVFIVHCVVRLLIAALALASEPIFFGPDLIRTHAGHHDVAGEDVIGEEAVVQAESPGATIQDNQRTTKGSRKDNYHSGKIFYRKKVFDDFVLQMQVTLAVIC